MMMMMHGGAVNKNTQGTVRRDTMQKNNLLLYESIPKGYPAKQPYCS